MIQIKSIQELLNQGVDKDQLLKLCDKLYEMTDFITTDYPKHKSWFYQKHLPATFKSNSGRDIIFARDENGKIYGTAFIKQDAIEKKICTLFVNDESRGLGIGSKLIEKSMELLHTTKPLVTFADYKLPMFESFIKKYDWKQTQVVKGLYNDKSAELVYNGQLGSPELGGNGGK